MSDFAYQYEIVEIDLTQPVYRDKLSMILGPKCTEAYAKLYSRLGNLKYPITYWEGAKLIFLIGVEDVDAARLCSQRFIKVIALKLEEKDIIPIVCFGYFFAKRAYHTIYLAACYLGKKLKRNWKKEWVMKVEGDTVMHKTAVLLDCSYSKLQQVLFMGKHDKKLLKAIEQDRIGFVEAKEALKRRLYDMQDAGAKKKNGKREAARQQFNDNIQPAVPDAGSAAEVSKYPLFYTTSSIENLGVFEFKRSSTGEVSGTFNGEPVANIIYDARPDRAGMEEECMRYIINFNNMDCSYTLIINNPKKLKKDDNSTE